MSAFKYVDVLASISISKGVARLEFGMHSDPEDESLEGVESVSKICMPLDGILRMHSTLNQVITRLQNDGVLVKQGEEKNSAENSTIDLENISKN